MSAEPISDRVTTATIATSVSEETLVQLQALARSGGRTVEDLASRAIEEYVRCARFPAVRFIDTADGDRKAILPGGHSIWGIVFNARGFAMDADKTAEHLEIPVETVRQALAYYAAYPEEIDAHLRSLEEFAEDPQRFSSAVRVMNLSDLGDEASP